MMTNSTVGYYPKKNILVFLLVMFSIIPACGSKQSRTNEYEDHVYQYSILDALLAGVYDGDLTIEKLKLKGDFGLGTFNRVDGELLMHEGIVYKIRYDGAVQVIPGNDNTPFAIVKTFEPDSVFEITGDNLTYEDLKKRLDKALEKNEVYAIRIRGSFSGMLTRAPAPATKPYPPLAEHLKKNQHTFDLGATRGIGAGFYIPSYMDGINVPGFHFHYLATDKLSGGHILDFQFDKLTIEIDKAAGFIVETIKSNAFRQMNTQTKRLEEAHQVESGKY